jgi:hypothetical protein
MDREEQTRGCTLGTQDLVRDGIYRTVICDSRNRRCVSLINDLQRAFGSLLRIRVAVEGRSYEALTAATRYDYIVASLL